MIADVASSSSSDHLDISNVRESIVGVDAQVPLFDGSSRIYVNLDNAATTPALRPVLDSVNTFMTWYSSIHRGTGLKSWVSSVAYGDARDIVCEFVKADPATHCVIFGKNTTEALNKLGRRLPLAQGDVVLTTLMEHHSNDLPWRKVCRVERIGLDGNGALNEQHLDYLLQKYAEHVRLVSVTGASNVTGYLNPIHRIAEKVHAAGAEFAVDAAQLAPHRAIDMRPDDDPGHIDYLALSGHKLYAPFGTGALIGRREPFLQGDPDQVGGGTVDIVTVDEVEWTHLPDKEEAGSPNVVGAVALAKAMLCLQEIGMEKLAEHEASLTAYLLKKLNSTAGVKVYGLTDPARARERVGVIAFSLEGTNHYLTAAILSAEGGIGVRNGCFCAHPYILQLLDVTPEQAQVYQQAIRAGSKALAPGLVRASFGCYNNESEVDWFVEMLERIVRGAYQGHYVQDSRSGMFWPEGFGLAARSFFRMR